MLPKSWKKTLPMHLGLETRREMEVVKVLVPAEYNKIEEILQRSLPNAQIVKITRV